MRQLQSGKYWHSEQVQSMKHSVKSWLDQESDSAEPATRLVLILAALRDVEPQTDAESLLRQYVLAMSALVHHVRWGGLREGQPMRLLTTAENILRLQNIDATSSRLAFLHDELNLVRGQLDWLSGRSHGALWCGLLAAFGLSGRQSNHQATPHAELGRRYLRLAMGDMAIHHFQAAIRHAHTSAQKNSYTILLANASRLTGRHDDARRQLSDLATSPELSDAHRMDMHWEEACLDVAATGDVRPLCKLVAAGRPHAEPGYLAEAKLYTFATPSRRMMQQLSRVATYANGGNLSRKAAGTAHEALIALERAYDTEVPLNLRLGSLREIVEDVATFISLEKELLFIAAAVRFLVRAHSYPLATFLLHLYRSKLATLNPASTKDPLGLLDDLFAKPWFCQPGSDQGDIADEVEPRKLA